MNTLDLPDFEDLFGIIEKVRTISLEKMFLEAKIKHEEAKVMVEARSNSKYFENGKPPAISFIESTYLFTGFDNSLLPLREKLAELSSELEYHRMRFQLEKDKIDVWRTQSANERNATL